MAGGLLIGAVGLAWLTQIGVHTSYWAYVFGPQVLMSLGLGLSFPAFASTALVKVRESDAGVASALVNTTQQVGGSLGTALLNTVAATATAAYLATHGPAFAAAGLVHGYSVAFAFGAGMLLLAAIVSAVLVTGGPREAAAPAGRTCAGAGLAQLSGTNGGAELLEDRVGWGQAPHLEGDSLDGSSETTVAAHQPDRGRDP